MSEIKKYCYEYPRPAVTTDSVIFGFDEGELKILLIERGLEPFKGQWALPGGFMQIDEDAETCALRELKEETGVCNAFMEQLYTFSKVDRDPRYRVISIAYYALVKLSDYKVEAGDDASKAQWFPLSEVPPLAFDHEHILQTAIERLKGKIRYQPIGFELLPEKFTIPDLQRLYEVTLQTKLDRRNFRKKFLCTGLLIDLSEQVKGVPHKGAKLYRFDKAKYEELTRKGFYFEI
ncbi:MAG: NUDIX hydrolase [Bacteroidales bacterium]|jgi:8-oxo-dGTP diphosphatase|nr:NUDIX hydrolase [Bacteroidales bacterium]